MNYADRATEQSLIKLEKRITDMFSEAAKDLNKIIDEYFSALAKRTAEMAQLVKEGKLSAEDFKKWRLAQIGRGKRFEAMRDNLAHRIADANEIALSYVNDALPEIYALNRNYTAYTLEQLHPGLNFTLFDEMVVRRLLVDQPDLMPSYPEKRALKRGIDLAYSKKVITSTVTKHILMGADIYKIADELQERLTGMERASAIRAARTAYTAATNGGRQDGFEEAATMGITVRKRWNCVHDLRTRYSHGMMDGQIVPFNEPFKFGSEEIMFPGDTSLNPSPAMVYNCRCAMSMVEKDGIDVEPEMIRVRNPLTGRNEVIEKVPYSEWLAQKKAENPEGIKKQYALMQNKYSDRKLLARYHAIIGAKYPQTLDEFQKIKYNSPEKWDYLKRLVRYMGKYPTSSKAYFDASEELKNEGINRGVLLPSVPHRTYILPEGKKDPNHIINRMLERQITDDELRHYMDDAKAMFVQWGGNRRLYVAKDGMAVTVKVEDADEWRFKTAWKSPSDDDEVSDTIRRVLRNHGLL